MTGRRLLLALLALLLLAGCGEEKMAEVPRYDTYEPAKDWPDNQSARYPPDNWTKRGQDLDAPGNEIPMPITMELLQRGQTVYEINCVPCHGATGYGDGMVVRRGFPEPPSYHIDRLRRVPPKYIYRVITEGYGIMYSYATRVVPRDRWAVAAYIKALQLSQHVQADSLDAAALERLSAGASADSAEAQEE